MKNWSEVINKNSYKPLKTKDLSKKLEKFNKLNKLFFNFMSPPIDVNH